MGLATSLTINNAGKNNPILETKTIIQNHTISLCALEKKTEKVYIIVRMFLNLFSCVTLTDKNILNC